MSHANLPSGLFLGFGSNWFCRLPPVCKVGLMVSAATQGHSVAPCAGRAGEQARLRGPRPPGPREIRAPSPVGARREREGERERALGLEHADVKVWSNVVENSSRESRRERPEQHDMRRPIRGIVRARDAEAPSPWLAMSFFWQLPLGLKPQPVAWRSYSRMPRPEQDALADLPDPGADDEERVCEHV